MKTFILGIASLLFVISSVYAAPSNNKSSLVTLTEYYDYECPHCRRMTVVLDKLQAAYPTLTIVYRVTPLLNAISPDIAKLALAAHDIQGNIQLHNALLASQQTPTVSSTLQLAKQLGIKPQSLLHMATKRNLLRQLQNNIKSANHYAIHGIIHLPIIVLANTIGEHFILYGEKPLTLLVAVVQQLEQDNAQMAQKTNHS